MINFRGDWPKPNKMTLFNDSFVHINLKYCSFGYSKLDLGFTYLPLINVGKSSTLPSHLFLSPKPLPLDNISNK